MQAQATRTEAITASQSLTTVQTMLRAGLGCITFLRNLLPEENFTESYFTTADGSMSYQSFDGDETHNKTTKRNVSSFKIKTMTRGYTDEADRIMNYIEHGIFDALQKQYLRSFIFAIYLDSKEPNNIVEAYTFNFQYHTVDGAVIPIMTLGDNLSRMSLGAGSSQDPIAEAVKRGRPPTLKEVKQSVKTLLKTLIHAITQLDLLPKRRYASFKLFYTDSTPQDYEPPYFQAGDEEKDKWYFMTHDLDEAPEKWSIGKVSTGHHSVNVSVTSIASYLPNSVENDNAVFAGTVSHPTIPTLTPMQEASLRVQQIEMQNEDAENRNVAWVAENLVELCDVDAEGEPDPDYTPLEGEHPKPISFEESIPTPFGLRDESGQIRPLEAAVDINEHRFGGISEDIPTKLQELLQNIRGKPVALAIGETQLAETQEQPTRGEIEDSPRSPVNSMLPPSDIPGSLEGTTPPHNENGAAEDVEMLDLETQIMGPIESISSFGSTPQNHYQPTKRVPSGLIRSSQQDEDSADNGLDCECGIAIEGMCCFCEGGCGRWFHVWCMGYHSENDLRMPSKFTCFDCRVRADSNWDLLEGELYPKMLNKFKDLALFRRAIKSAESMKKPSTLAEFTKAVGCDTTVARPLFKRLEDEGFILQQSTIVNELGLVETHVRNTRGKGKAKQSKPKKNIQKSKYVFNHQVKSTLAYSNYFDPDREADVLGIAELKPTAGSSKQLQKDVLNQQPETQTQDGTPEPVLHKNKRILSIQAQEFAPTKKKIKISVTSCVDLAE
ncbi:DNA-binding protein [Pluteus cervinus]|uniref:DNA-binding protein n=1 Tax=Pluteus cervinus TaxID=181527 RepID=A0ACD3BDV9_9AGAR|nr:DNA-binding protein [Pluteus cervinus]